MEKAERCTLTMCSHYNPDSDNGCMSEFLYDAYGCSNFVALDGPVAQTDNIDNTDNIDHPPRYTAHPSGVECIQITQHMNFCIGNAFKYLWRAGLKGDASEDLHKAKKYIEFELERLENK